MLEIGPVLHPDDAVANKVTTLNRPNWVRFEPPPTQATDFLDTGMDDDAHVHIAALGEPIEVTR